MYKLSTDFLITASVPRMDRRPCQGITRHATYSKAAQSRVGLLAALLPETVALPGSGDCHELDATVTRQGLGAWGLAACP